MTTINTSSSTALVHAAHVLNYVESTSEVLNALTRYGYDAQHLSTGRQLLEQTTNSQKELEALELRQKALTEQFNSEWKQIKQLQQVHLQTARRCLANELAHLFGPVAKSYTLWAAETNRFYVTLLSNPSYLAKMNNMGIATDALERTSQSIASLMQIKDVHNQNRAIVSVVQQQKDTYQQEFKRWFGVLLATARIALRTQPAMLQVLFPAIRSKSNTGKDNTVKELPSLPPGLATASAIPMLAAYS